ncbi:MAG: hypothetical protein HY292_17500 [Planctomycetes bacterium]|nr:hypothetical protein [Planctomycetota bacterium]
MAYRCLGKRENSVVVPHLLLAPSMSTQRVLRCVACALTIVAAPAILAPAQLSWSLRANAPNGGQLVYDSMRGVTFLFGFEETWEWNGATWVLREPSAAARGGNFTYDSVRGRTVCFAGDGATWEWDGLRWSDVSPSVGPPARSYTALAFDAARGRTVLFGGSLNWINQYSDTWEWDGTTWTEQFPSTLPHANALPSLAYDARRGVTVLYGGQDVSGVPRDQTWEWDGTDWTRRTNVGSPGWRSNFQMLFEAARGRVVLIAPSINNPARTDKWEYDGTLWRRMDVTSVFPPSAHLSIAADDGRSRLVAVLQGYGTFGTWEWNGTVWQEVVAARHPRLDIGTFTPKTLSFDSSRGRTLSFSPSYPSPTWEWDGHSWQAVTSPTTPTFDHYVLSFALTCDSVRGVTVLVADIGSGPLQTWEWDGVDWTRRTPPVSPLSDYFYITGIHLAFDSLRGVTLLYRGRNDVWEWDGTTWSQRLSTGGPAREQTFSMAFDAARGRAVLLTRSQPPQTWEWDGQRWTPASPTDQPPLECTFSTFYDAALGGVVAIGATCAGGLWVWDGVDWHSVALHDDPTSPDDIDAVAYDSARDRVVIVGGSQTWELGPPTSLTTTTVGSAAGGDLVILNGFNVTDRADTDVRFGVARAEVVALESNRITVRTPPGSGRADVVFSNSLSSVRVPGAFEYIAPEIAARYGNVGVVRGDRENVLLVNALTGDPSTRIVDIPLRSPIDVVVVAPWSRTSARFALYAWPGAPDATTWRAEPRGVGTMVFPTPLDVGVSPQPIAIGNNLAPRLGVATFATHPAPTVIARQRRGIGHPLTLTLQGFIQDDGSAIPEHVSVTNAMILRVGP